ncbi:MAG: hypothetical protein OHK0046_42920 [Anaerolineae bacterium]
MMARKTLSLLRQVSIYAILILFAVFLLFPFIYMIFTSLKSSDDVFHYPPRLLAYTHQLSADGQPLYQFTIDGQSRSLIQTEEQVTVGFFTRPDMLDTENPRNSQIVAEVPLNEAVATGEFVTLPRSNGRTRVYDLFQVTLDGQVQPLALAYQGTMNVFVAPDDPAVRTLAFPRLAEPVEDIHFRFENYAAVFDLGLKQSFINTVFVTFGVMLGQILTSIMGGYAFARVQFPGRDRLFFLYLGSIMIPFVVLIIPLYRLMVEIGWQGELAALVIPWVFTAYGTFLMRQAFMTIPRDLEEAALMDGASRWRILWTIMVPLAKPTIATLAVFSFLYAWNSFLWPLLIIGQGNEASHVLTLSLTRLNSAYDQRPNLIMAGSAIAIVPPMIVFLFAQKYFIEGFATSGLKG